MRAVHACSHACPEVRTRPNTVAIAYPKPQVIWQYHPHGHGVSNHKHHPFTCIMVTEFYLPHITMINGAVNAKTPPMCLTPDPEFLIIC